MTPRTASRPASALRVSTPAGLLPHRPEHCAYAASWSVRSPRPPVPPKWLARVPREVAGSSCCRLPPRSRKRSPCGARRCERSGIHASAALTRGHTTATCVSAVGLGQAPSVQARREPPLQVSEGLVRSPAIISLPSRLSCPQPLSIALGRRAGDEDAPPARIDTHRHASTRTDMYPRHASTRRVPPRLAALVPLTSTRIDSPRAHASIAKGLRTRDADESPQLWRSVPVGCGGFGTAPGIEYRVRGRRTCRCCTLL